MMLQSAGICRGLTGTTEHCKQLLNDSANQFGSFEDISKLLMRRVCVYRQLLGSTSPLRYLESVFGVEEEGRFSQPHCLVQTGHSHPGPSPRLDPLLYSKYTL